VTLNLFAPEYPLYQQTGNMVRRLFSFSSIYIFLNAIGQALKSVNNLESDLSNMNEAKFTVVVDTTNPVGKDRTIAQRRTCDYPKCGRAAPLARQHKPMYKGGRKEQ
jgi:hypothetical protein